MLKGASLTSPVVGVIAIAFAIVLISVTLLAVLYERGDLRVANHCYSAETGSWENPKARPGDISRIEIETTCKNDLLVHRARTFTKCAPRDCTWGWTKGKRGPGGRFVAIYTTYSAHRFVELDISDDQAYAYLENDYHDSRKTRETATYTLSRVD